MIKLIKVQVEAYTKALVYRNGALEDVLSEGKHRIGFGRKVEVYDMTKPFLPNQEIDLLLRNEGLRSQIDVIEVGDSEIAIQYRKGNLHRVLGPGQYVYWKGGIDYSYQIAQLNDLVIDEAIDQKVLQLPALRPYVQVHVVESYEKAALFVDGKYEQMLGPGIYYYWKGQKAINTRKVDMRKQWMEVNGQELLTKDKASIRVNLTANYQVTDVYKAVVDAKDYAKQLYTLMQLGLREYVGQYSLDELLANKAAASPYLMDYAAEGAAELGVDLTTVGIRDIILPGDVKEIMNQVLVAEKKAQANVIMRREETASTRSLLNTAKLMQDNEMLYKLKEMEYVEKIADNIQNITLSGGGQLVDQLREVFGRG